MAARLIQSDHEGLSLLHLCTGVEDALIQATSLGLGEATAISAETGMP